MLDKQRGNALRPWKLSCTCSGCSVTFIVQDFLKNSAHSKPLHLSKFADNSTNSTIQEEEGNIFGGILLNNKYKCKKKKYIYIIS